MGVTRGDIEGRLRTILDPEMPINLVDLGIIAEIRIRDKDDTSAAAAQKCNKSAHVEIDVTPTFVGCPALDMIRDLIVDRVGGLPDVAEVAVRFVNDPPWSVTRISAEGREALRRHGVTTPHAGGAAAAITPLTISQPGPASDAVKQTVECPFCGSEKTHLDSPFGPTRCRMIYYCDACRNAFEHLKPI